MSDESASAVTGSTTPHAGRWCLRRGNGRTHGSQLPVRPHEDVAGRDAWVLWLPLPDFNAGPRALFSARSASPPGREVKLSLSDLRTTFRHAVPSWRTARGVAAWLSVLLPALLLAPWRTGVAPAAALLLDAVGPALAAVPPVGAHPAHGRLRCMPRSCGERLRRQGLGHAPAAPLRVLVPETALGRGFQRSGQPARARTRAGLLPVVGVSARAEEGPPLRQAAAAAAPGAPSTLSGT
jgi:hypothetical protein